MVNINRLKGKIVENSLTVAEVAKAIGIDSATLYRKLNNKGETFTIKEATTISEILKLSMEDVNLIFFA
ncbi:MAG: helix-turn-helix domain-containing protein [Candidatus Fimenecus sp.]